MKELGGSAAPVLWRVSPQHLRYLGHDEDAPRGIPSVDVLKHKKILWLMWGGAWLRHHGGGATEDHESETEMGPCTEVVLPFTVRCMRSYESPRPWVLSHRSETECPTVCLKVRDRVSETVCPMQMDHAR